MLMQVAFSNFQKVVVHDYIMTRRKTCQKIR